MYCPECGTEIMGDESFCGNCGFNLTTGPAKQMDKSYSQNENFAKRPQNQYQPPQYIDQSKNQYRPPQYTNQQQYGTTEIPPASMYYDLNPRSWGLWIILSICTCGIASFVYIYYNFDDTRKLEGLIQANRNVPFYKNSTADPVLGVILFFVCSPGAIFLKYSTLYNLINQFYAGQSTPQCASVSKIIGLWVGIFFSVILGAFVLPLLIIPIVLLIYLIYLDYQWQEVLNNYIMDNKNPSMYGSFNGY